MNTYLKSFEKSFGEKESILKNDNWEQYQTYDSPSRLRLGTVLEEEEKVDSQQSIVTNSSMKSRNCFVAVKHKRSDFPITYPSPPDTGYEYPEAGVITQRLDKEKKIRDIIIEKADDDDACS